MVESRNKFFISNFMINKADKPSMADFESCVWLWEAPGKTMAGALRQLSQKKFYLNVITGIIRESLC